MTRTNRWTTAALGVALIAATSTTAAAQTQVTGRDAIVDGTTVTWIGVSSPTNPFSITSGGTTIAVSTDGPFFSRLTAGSGWSGGFVSGDALLFTPAGSSITFDFSTAVTGFATQGWFNNGGSSTFFIEAFRGGSLTASYSVPGLGGASVNLDQAPVLGLTDAAGFDRIVLRGLGAGGSNEFAIDELTLGAVAGATVTPEPATVALLATGLAALGGFAARRRRREHAALG